MGEHENLMKKQAEPYGVLQSLTEPCGLEAARRDAETVRCGLIATYMEQSGTVKLKAIGVLAHGTETAVASYPLSRITYMTAQPDHTPTTRRATTPRAGCERSVSPAG